MSITKSSNKLVTTAIMAIAITLLLLSIAAPVNAQASGDKYEFNFASSKGGGSAQITPGNSQVFNITFYNVDGNRATHIKFDVVDKPDDWDVTVTPSKKQQTYSVSGVHKTLKENLRVPDPYTYEAMYGEKPPLDKIPENLSEDMMIIRVKGIDGYIPAKQAHVKISVPDDTRVEGSENVTVEATGFWLGSAESMVAFAQVREYHYNITVNNQHSKISNNMPKDTPHLATIVLLLVSLTISVGIWIKTR